MADDETTDAESGSTPTTPEEYNYLDYQALPSDAGDCAPATVTSEPAAEDCPTCVCSRESHSSAQRGATARANRSPQQLKKIGGNFSPNYACFQVFTDSMLIEGVCCVVVCWCVCV